jgi:hypothetical protein
MKNIIYLLIFISSTGCTQINSSNTYINDHITYKRIEQSGEYGFINNLSDTVIPIGKYKFVNPLDEKEMILATNHKDKQGYIDINERIIIPFIYDDLGGFAYNLTFAEKNGLFGYLNREGKTIIDFQFSKAQYFYESGVAVVKKKDGYGLIDTLGNIKINCVYDDIDYSRENQIAIVSKNNKYAFYFTDTEKLTDFEFDKIYESTNRIPEKGHYSTIKELYFNKNLALVEKDNQFSLINRDLKEIVKYGTYEKIKPMNCYGFSVVFKENKYGIIDSLGVLKVPLEYDLISTKPVLSYGNNFTTFLIKKNGKYQILNNNAELEIKKKFNKVDILSHNYYLAYENNSINLIDDNGKIVSNEYTGYYDFDEGFLVKKGSKMGAIDYNGKVILPFVYDSIFHPRLKKHLYASRNGKFGVIDFEGKVIIPFEYEFITRVWYDDYEEYAGNLIVQKNKKLGTINMKNETNIPIIYDGICSWIEYSPDEHYVKKDNKYGMVKPNGEMVVPCLYDYIHYYTGQTILVVKNRKYGILNRKNKIIIPCEYEKLIVDIDFWGFDENHKDKLVLLKDEKWYYYDLNGKLLFNDIDESEILKKHPNATKEINYLLDKQLILVQ